MRKIISQILVFVIIFNFIFSNFSVVIATGDYQYPPDAYEDGENNGTTYNPGGGISDVDAAATQSTVPSIIGTLASLVSLIPMSLMKIFNIAVDDAGYINVDEASTNWLTIQNIVFGNYYLLNANVFKDSSNLSVSDKDGHTPTSDAVAIVDSIKNSATQWYYILRLISLALGLITLIYIGIRMALSTVATDQAKYKKMLVGWVQSIGIIVLLPYIMRGLNFLNEILLDFARVVRAGLASAGGESFEVTIIETIYEKMIMSGGMESAAYSIAYLVLMWAQFKFFMMYIKRVLAVSFLTIISPLITITYSIDKSGDGKAQAFSAWLQEYSINMLIQPLQAFIYLIFVFSANEIAKVAPVVGIIFLLSLTRAERIVKTIFNMRKLSSMNTMKLFNKG